MKGINSVITMSKHIPEGHKLELYYTHHPVNIKNPYAGSTIQGRYVPQETEAKTYGHYNHFVATTTTALSKKDIITQAARFIKVEEERHNSEAGGLFPAFEMQHYA